jgi:regulator of sigma E protease
MRIAQLQARRWMLYSKLIVGPERKQSVVSEIQLLTILQFAYGALLVLFFFGLTIFIHELGHFLLAKKCGMKIERFSIGFGPRLWGFTKNGVDYRISWFPFGGYVALPQMSPMEVIEGKTETPAEELPPAPPSSKILVACAGPLMNIALAIFLSCVIWYIGLPMPNDSSVVGWVEPNSAEEQLGIQPGDRIVAINDQPVHSWTDLMGTVATSHDSTLRVVIERDGERLVKELEAESNPRLGMKMVNLYPQSRPFARKIEPGSPAEQSGVQPGDRFLAIDRVPVFSAQQLIELIGKREDKPTELKVMRQGEVLTLAITPRNLDRDSKAIRIGVMLGDEVVRPGPTPVRQFQDVFKLMGYTINALFHSKQTGVGVRSLSGPVGIMGGWWLEFVYGGIRRGLWLAVILNINLAIINLLPIPVLDGGHIVFAALERIRRRPLNARIINAASMTFAVLIISFMLYVTFFDIQRFVSPAYRSNNQPKTNETIPATEPAR